MTELHPIIYDIAPSVADNVYRRYKSFVERDDVLQECLMWAMKRAAYVNEQLSEPVIETRIHNERRLIWQMRRAAERYVRKEKAFKSGYQISDEVYYESATLGQLLPFVIASVFDNTVLEQAQEMIRDGQPKGSSSPAEGGNLLAMLIDIKKGYLRLEIEEQIILRMRYHDHYTLTQISHNLECAVSTADRRCTNALKKLLEQIGGESPFR